MAATKETDAVEYVQDVATGAIYDGTVTPELAKACKSAPTLAESKTQRDEYGNPSGVVWVVAPELAPGTPIPGEYKTVTVIKVSQGS